MNMLEIIKSDDLEKLKGQKIEVAQPDSYFAIHIAAQHKSLKIIEFLSETQQCKTTEDGQTALMICAENDCFEAVKFLQKELKLKNNDGQTALMIAAMNKCHNIIPYLLDEMNIQDDDGFCALMLAVQENDVEGVKLLKQERKLEDSDGLNALQIAILRENWDVVKVLWEEETDKEDMMTYAKEEGCFQQLKNALAIE